MNVLKYCTTVAFALVEEKNHRKFKLKICSLNSGTKLYKKIKLLRCV